MPYDLQKQQELEAARERDNRQQNFRFQSRGTKGESQKFPARNPINKGKVGQAAQTIQTTKNLAKNANPWGAISLLREVSLFTDWMYGIALFFAIFKDILDLLNLTGLGYIIVFIATICCSAFIAMMMILGSTSSGEGSGRAQLKMSRWLVLLGGTTIEMIFGVDILPIETLTVLVVYFMLLSSRQAARVGQTSQNNLQPQES